MKKNVHSFGQFTWFFVSLKYAIVYLLLLVYMFKARAVQTIRIIEFELFQLYRAAAATFFTRCNGQQPIKQKQSNHREISSAIRSMPSFLFDFEG